MDRTNSDVLSAGMNCLTEHLGVIEAERFISIIIREKFDYTKWQRDYFDRKTPEEISREAEEYERAHPFDGSAQRI